MDDSQFYVGADLGMVNSILAYTDANGIVSVKRWDDGQTKFPSAILITPRGKYAGQDIYRRMRTESRYHYENCFKRMMGTTHKERIFNVEYTPTEMVAMILKKMVSAFEEDHGERVERIVLAVPSDFGGAEREATYKAAYLAGIKEIKILNESDAAAIAYCHDTPDFRGNVAIYDMGGGTFDVTIISVSDSGFAVKSNEGSKFLGGRDWDLHLASIIQKRVVDLSGMRPQELDRNSDLRKRILSEAEKIKIILDNVEEARGVVDVNGMPIEFTVTREELNRSTEALIDKTLDMIRSAISCAGLTDRSLDRMVLVGGQSLTPYIWQKIEEAFPYVELLRYDPINAVARGAALYARSYFKTRDIKLSSILSKTYGLKMGIDGKERICNILYRNIQLPIKRTVVCRPKRDDQESLSIEVYENKSDTTVPDTEVSHSRLVNRFTVPLKGKITRGRTKITIDMESDYEGIVKITTVCNGITEKCDLGKYIYLTDEEFIESMRKVGSVQ